jgi:hypothetical protein
MKSPNLDIRIWMPNWTFKYLFVLNVLIFYLSKSINYTTKLFSKTWWKNNPVQRSMLSRIRIHATHWLATRWSVAAAHWSDPYLFCKTSFDPLGRDQSSFRLPAVYCKLNELNSLSTLSVFSFLPPSHHTKNPPKIFFPRTSLVRLSLGFVVVYQ